MSEYKVAFLIVLILANVILMCIVFKTGSIATILLHIRAIPGTINMLKYSENEVEHHKKEIENHKNLLNQYKEANKKLLERSKNVL